MGSAEVHAPGEGHSCGMRCVHVQWKSVLLANMQKCFMSFRGGESILILTHVSSLGWSFVRIQLTCAQLSLLILPIESEFQDAVCAFGCGGVCTGWVSGISHWEVLRLLVCLLKIRSGMLKRCPPNAAAQRDVSLVAHCMTFLHGLLA